MQENRVLYKVFISCCLFLFFTHIFCVQVEKIKSFKNGDQRINCIKWSDDGKYVALIDTESVSIWMVSKGMLCKRFKNPAPCLQAMDQLRHMQDFYNNFFWSCGGNCFNMYFGTKKYDPMKQNGLLKKDQRNRDKLMESEHTMLLTYNVRTDKQYRSWLNVLSETVYQTPFFAFKENQLLTVVINCIHSGIIKYCDRYNTFVRSFNNYGENAFLLSPSRLGKKIIVLYLNGDICIHDVKEEKLNFLSKNKITVEEMRKPTEYDHKIVSGLKRSSKISKVILYPEWKKVCYEKIKNHQITWSANDAFAVILKNQPERCKSCVRVIDINAAKQVSCLRYNNTFVVEHAIVDNYGEHVYLLVRCKSNVECVIRVKLLNKTCSCVLSVRGIPSITSFALSPCNNYLVLGKEDGSFEFYTFF
jgi:hypothetical protein